MPILISKTYAEITPESAEDGDFSDTGFVFENTEYTFRELVDALKDCTETSDFPSTGDINTWASTGFNIEDYATMTERQESIHFCRENAPRYYKYWPKALRAAGLIK